MPFHLIFQKWEQMGGLISSTCLKARQGQGQNTFLNRELVDRTGQSGMSAAWHLPATLEVRSQHCLWLDWGATYTQDEPEDGIWSRDHLISGRSMQVSELSGPALSAAVSQSARWDTLSKSVWIISQSGTVCFCYISSHYMTSLPALQFSHWRERSRFQGGVLG